MSELDAGAGTPQTTNTTRSYVIISASDLDNIDFSQVMQTNRNTCRLSVDESKSLIKYIGDMPSSVVALNTKSQEYTNDEIIDILATEEWTPSEDSV